MIRKPVYMYSFSTEKESAEFLKLANQQFDAAFGQHPLTNNKPNLLRVLVTGSGSITHDIALKDFLDAKASELNGVYLAKK